MEGSNDSSDQRVEASVDGLPPRIADDQFYQALASTRRRRILYYLLTEDACSVEELVSVLSGWEVTTTATMHTPADRSTIQIQLQHSDLPLLDDAELIEYDQTAGTVQLQPVHNRVTAIIRQSIEAERCADAA